MNSGHVRMWELYYEESWASKNWCAWTVVLEKTLESPLDCKEIQPVHPKGDQFWVFIERTDAEAETPIFWPPHVKSWLIGKKPWCWEGLGAGEERDDRGWDGWMASPPQSTWVWVNSGSWWWTERPGVLWFIGSQVVGHDWAIELNWRSGKECNCKGRHEDISLYCWKELSWFWWLLLKYTYVIKLHEVHTNKQKYINANIG